jgi:SET domain-containing protein
MGENVKAKEFIGEYKGEIIGRPEADRRGTVDFYREISYLFTLNPRKSSRFNCIRYVG